MTDIDSDPNMAVGHVDPIVAIVIDTSESAERSEATAGVAIRAALRAVGSDRVLVVGQAATEAWARRDGVRWLGSDGTPLGGLEVAVLAADGAPLLYCSGNDAVIASGLDALLMSLGNDAVTVSGTEWDVDGEPVRTPAPFDWVPRPGTLIATGVVAPDTERRGLVAALRAANRGGWRNLRTDAVTVARIGDTSAGARVRTDASIAAAIVRSVRSSIGHRPAGDDRNLTAAVADAARALRGLAVLATMIAASTAIVASGTRGPGSQWAVPAIGLAIVVAGALALMERQRPGGDVCELVRAIDVSTAAITAAAQRPRPHRARRMRTGGRALLARPVTTVATIALESAITYAAVRLATTDRARPADTWPPIAALVAGVVLLTPMLVSLGVVVRVRPRRASSRAELTFSAAVDGRPFRVVDVSIGGLAVAASKPIDVGDRVAVLLDPGHGALPMTVVRCSPNGRRYTIGLQLDPDAPAAARAALERTWLDATQRTVTAPVVHHARASSSPGARSSAARRAAWTIGGSVAVRVTTAVTLIALGAAALPPYPTSFATGAVVVVNSTGTAPDASAGDGICETSTAGQCTLRAAIQEANASPTIDTIAFGIPTGDPGHAAGVWTIAETAPLTVIAPVTLDATTQPGYSVTPVVALNGSGAGFGSGIVFDASGGTVRGLAVGDYPENGIVLNGGAGLVVERSHVGVGPDGLTAAPNGGNGIYVSGGYDVIIGGPEVGNVLSGNGLHGVVVEFSDNVTIDGNMVGVAADGSSARPNGRGVSVDSSTNVTVGGAQGNVISGNTGVGVGVTGGAVAVRNNRIGTNATGSAAVPNHGTAVALSFAGSSQILDNTISGNAGDGVYSRNGDRLIIQGNEIGVSSTGTVAIANTGDGLDLNGDVHQIGGRAAGAGNVIAGNTGHGINLIWSSATIIEGNFIGTSPSGSVDLGNGAHGVWMRNPSEPTMIAGTAVGASNVIEFNTLGGVSSPTTDDSPSSTVPQEASPAPKPAGEPANDTSTKDVAAVLEQNRGQFDEPVDFVVRGEDATVFLADGALVYDAREGDDGQVVRMEFDGAENDVEPVAIGLEDAVINYFLGADRARWVTDVEVAHMAWYDDVLDGVDIRYLGTGDGLRYDLFLDPGVDPSSIALTFEGADGVTLAPDGALAVEVSVGEDLAFSAPVTYQDTPNGRVMIESAYIVGDDGVVRFDVGDHDQGLPLVIDPTLELGTYLGGAGTDQAFDVAVDATGGIVVVGTSDASDYPTSVGAYDVTFGGGGDVVVSKLDEAGSTLLWSTYVGGSAYDVAKSVAVNGDGDIIVVGDTHSANFPTTLGAFDRTHDGSSDGFAFELAASGSALNASTLFGASSNDFADTVDLDSSNNVIVGGLTSSSGFPVTSGAYDTTKTGTATAFDGYAIEFGSTLGTVSWGTFLGAAGNETMGEVSVDTADRVYVSIASTSMATTTGAYDTTNNGSVDTWVGRLNATGTTLQWGTWLGGTGSEAAPSTVQWVSDTRVYVGSLATSGFPTSLGAYSTTLGGSFDTALVVFDPTASGSAQLVYGSFLGGVGFGSDIDLAVDGFGRAYLAGQTGTAGLGTAGAPDPSHNGGFDGYLAVMSATTATLDLLTYIGGSSQESATGVVVTPADEVVVTGHFTSSSGVATTVAAYDTSFGGSTDVFVHRYTALPPADFVTVNSTGDAADASAGNGVCSTGGTNSAGAPACTLRAAIQEANASAAIDTVGFAIPTTESGYSASPLGFVVNTTSALPPIAQPVTIDATTQSQYGSNAGRPVVVLQGTSAGTTDGLVVADGGDGSTIRGLLIRDFTGDGVEVQFGADGVVIEANHIGRLTTDGGTAAAGLQNSANGIRLLAAGARVGGTSSSQRNVIAGNTADGVLVGTRAGNQILGNYLGVRTDGTSVLANGSNGVEVGNATGTVIDGNVISGNTREQVYLNGSDDSMVQANLIGTDAAGTAAPTGLGSVEEALRIGVGANGNLVGGVDPADANTMAYATLLGVYVEGVDNAIIGNSIHTNAVGAWSGLGIDFAAAGPTLNDTGDADTGANDLLNFPVITSASETGGTVTVDFTLDVPSGSYRVEFFSNPSGADPSGYGEGEVFVHAESVAHAGGGAQAYSASFTGSVGDVITATTTEDLSLGDFGSTSEFSAAATVTSDTVTVNSTGDASDASAGNGVCATGSNNSAGQPACTLRAAIQEANASPMIDTIVFDVPVTEVGHSGGVWTIAPGSALPALSTSITVDATTQPGYASTPIISIDGSGTAGGPGLNASGDDVTVRGVNVRRFPGDGVSVTGARFTLEASHIGTNAAGTAASPNSLSGLLIAGPDAAIRGNLISGNSSNGVRVQSGGDRARIVDNYVGTTVTGNAALPNGQEGVEIDEADDVVVGEPGLGNVLSGNDFSGINGWAGDASGAVIQGNLIGVGADGSTALGNSAAVVEGGITIRGPVHDWTIGGTGPGEGNVIANNIGDGISLIDVNGVADDIAIVGNSIHADTGLGIDIDDDGVSANDAGDADSGINGRLNAPLISSAIVTGGTAEVAYSLDVPAGNYRVEFFVNPSGADPSGYGEGETFVHDEMVSPAGLGAAGFTASFAASAGAVITATVTEDLGGGSFGSTSEFSAAVLAAVTTTVVVVNSTGDGADAAPGNGVCDTGGTNAEGDPECTLRAAIREANVHPTVDTIEFDIPVIDANHVAGTWTIAPATALPDITAPVDIDGTTQPGTVINTAQAPDPMNGRLAIELSGAADPVTSDWDGLRLLGGSDGSTIRGLAITGWDNPASDAILVWNSSGNVLAGNFIGVDADGTGAADGVTAGVGIGGGSTGTRVGGTAAADRNLIANDTASGNAWAGVWAGGASNTGIVVQGNEIGLRVGGAAAPAGWAGIHLMDGATATIGGAAAAAANRITGHAKGVIVDAGPAPAHGSIVGNRIWGNGIVAIDLDGDGVTLNDPGDADTGPNDLLNFPVITSAVVSGATVEVSYSLDVPAGNYRVEFFTNPSGADPTGYGEGEVLAHAETISPAGFGPAGFTASFTGSAGDVITATVTEDLGGGSYGSTSEFSAAVFAASSTVVVNSTGDGGDAVAGDGACDTGGVNSEGDDECTLRAAIQEANAHAMVDTIEFDIPLSDPGNSADVWTIQPSTALPTVTAAVVIDGTSQPGWATTPVIALDGSGLGGATDGVTLGAGSGGSEVRGLAVGGFPGHGVVIDFGSSGNLIAGNHIGTDAAGLVDVGNGSAGILVWTDGNRIGGATAADRNVISGNDGYGIFVGATTGNVFQGNHIGVDVTGNAALGNTWNGIYLGGGDGNVVDGNVIGDNGDIGVRLEGGSNHVITANSIGVGADGVSDVGNLVGVSARFGTTDIVIGGSDPSDANVIADNGHGILVMDAGTARVAIIGNEIRDNDDLGIDLDDDGVTANDAGDADTGPNDHLNFPVITSATARSGQVDITFDLDVPAGSYRIELFANPSGTDPTGYGEGEVLVDGFTVTHPGGGRRTYTTRIAGAAGDVLTATATEDLGGGAFGATSELSQAATVGAAAATVRDLSPRRSDLATAGGASGPGGAGVAGTGVTFGGGNQRLVGPATDLTSGSVTLSAWVQLDAISTSPRLVSKRAQSGAIYELLVDDVTGAAEARFGIGGSEATVQGGALAVGTWHQVAATWDGSMVRLYVDGAEVAQAPASGALATDLSTPLVVGNVVGANRGLIGPLDTVQIAHTARSSAWIETAYLNQSDPTGFVSVGEVETAATGSWSASSTEVRNGGWSLAAPAATSGAEAWATATGLDEPGLAFESWWYVTAPATSRIAAGTNAGATPIEQRELGATDGTVDLATRSVGGRTVDATSSTAVPAGTWTRVEIRTDELGRSTAWIDGVQVIGPTTHGGGTSAGTVGLRAGTVGTGGWYIDDVRIRRYVSDEPTTTLGPLHRN